MCRFVFLSCFVYITIYSVTYFTGYEWTKLGNSRLLLVSIDLRGGYVLLQSGILEVSQLGYLP